MPEIKLEHVTKRWGKFYAVDDLDLVIQDNAFVTPGQQAQSGLSLSKLRPVAQYDCL